MSTAQGQRIKCKVFTVKEDLFQEMRRQCVCVGGRQSGKYQAIRQRDQKVLSLSAGKRL